MTDLIFSIRILQRSTNCISNKVLFWFVFAFMIQFDIILSMKVKFNRFLSSKGNYKNYYLQNIIKLGASALIRLLVLRWQLRTSVEIIILQFMECHKFIELKSNSSVDVKIDFWVDIVDHDVSEVNKPASSKFSRAQRKKLISNQI